MTIDVLYSVPIVYSKFDVQNITYLFCCLCNADLACMYVLYIYILLCINKKCFFQYILIPIITYESHGF
jgi:hypothetical protein